MDRLGEGGHAGAVPQHPLPQSAVLHGRGAGRFGRMSGGIATHNLGDPVALAGAGRPGRSARPPCSRWRSSRRTSRSPSSTSSCRRPAGSDAFDGRLAIRRPGPRTTGGDRRGLGAMPWSSSTLARRPPRCPCWQRDHRIRQHLSRAALPCSGEPAPFPNACPDRPRPILQDVPDGQKIRDRTPSRGQQHPLLAAWRNWTSSSTLHVAGALKHPPIEGFDPVLAPK